MKSNTSFLIGIVAFLILSSCSARFPRTDYPDDRYPGDERRDRDDRDNKEGDGRNYPLSSLGIPKGQLPPPGECKVWFPNRPAGQQPPPQSCASALRNAPLGAWVITHEGERYKVNIFSRSKRNVIDEVRYYLAQ